MRSHSTLRAHFDTPIITLDTLPTEYYKLLVALYQHFEGQIKNFVSMTCKVSLVLHSLYFLYHTHNTSLLIDKHGPDKLSCYIPAAPIIKIDVCYMTDAKSIRDK